nr:PrgI family protein [Candidatus Woesebacteria bacterium]
MQEHPVPQNVTGYEFHLIGQMTLKQFMEIAAGVILAVVINMTNLPVFIKYPLMAIAGLTGVALAFVPLEGRPLDRWFLAFVRSIYQPTMFFWKKTQTVPDVFEYKVPANLDTTPKVDYKPLRDSRVKEFLTTLPSASVSTQPDDDDLRAQAILALFESPSVKPTPQLIPPTPIQEAMKIPLPTKTE